MELGLRPKCSSINTDVPSNFLTTKHPSLDIRKLIFGKVEAIIAGIYIEYDPYWILL